MLRHPAQRLIFASSLLSLLLTLSIASPAASQGAVHDTARVSAATRDLPLSAEQRSAFIGHYKTIMPGGENTWVDVSEQDGQLKAQPEGMAAVRILYQGDNRFRPEGIPDFEFRFEVANGRATRFTVQKEDGLMVGTRVD